MGMMLIFRLVSAELQHLTPSKIADLLRNLPELRSLDVVDKYLSRRAHTLCYINVDSVCSPDRVP